MLSRRDPFREFMSLRRAMDLALEDVVSDTETEWPTRTWRIPVDVSETEDEYMVEASVPGMDIDDLEITFNNNVLTIKGEFKAEREEKEETYHLRERRYGTFSRSIAMPSDVDAENIQADYEKGILTLHLPKAEEAKPRRIEIQSGERKKAIEG